MDTYDDIRRRPAPAAPAGSWADGVDRRMAAQNPIRVRRTGAPDAIRRTPQAALIVNPTGDRAFDEHARRLAAASEDPLQLQTRLRQHWPRAVVRRRELSGETFEMWYVYRDGSWSPAEP